MASPDLIVQIGINALMVGLLLALAAVGLSLIFGVSGVVNIAHGEFIMLSGYVTFFAFSIYGLSPLLSLFITIPLGAILGYAIYRLFIAGIMDRKTLEEDSLLITFGLSYIFINTARYFWRTDIRSYRYLTGSYDVLGYDIPRTQLIAGIIALVLYAIVYVSLQQTSVGKAIRATAQNRDQAKRVGINTSRIDAVTFTFASALAAASGSLLSMIYIVTPFMGLDRVIDAFVVVVLGGLGSIVGSLVGAIIFSFTREYGALTFSQPIGQMIALSIIFIVFFLRPQGLFGQIGYGGDEE